MVWVVKLLALWLFRSAGSGDGFQSLGWFWGAAEFQVVELRQSVGGPGFRHGQGSQAAALSTQDKYLHILS